MVNNSKNKWNHSLVCGKRFRMHQDWLVAPKTLFNSDNPVGPYNRLFSSFVYLEDNCYHFIAPPYIRLLFNGGHYATVTLFVISGYVVSRRPLELIETGRIEYLSEYLSSAIFRRWMRLHLPLISTAFLYMTSWHVFSLRIRWIRPEQSYADEFRKWLREVMDYGFPFSRAGSLWLSYNDHLRSILGSVEGLAR